MHIGLWADHGESVLASTSTSERGRRELAYFASAAMSAAPSARS